MFFMGMYDTVIFTCEVCGRTLSVQSKSGECLLKEYNADHVPLDIAIGVLEDEYEGRAKQTECDCGATYTFEFKDEDADKIAVFKWISNQEIDILIEKTKNLVVSILPILIE